MSHFDKVIVNNIDANIEKGRLEKWSVYSRRRSERVSVSIIYFLGRFDYRLIH
jgi:hypothetical protein